MLDHKCSEQTLFDPFFSKIFKRIEIFLAIEMRKWYIKVLTMYLSIGGMPIVFIYFSCPLEGNQIAFKSTHFLFTNIHLKEKK